MTRARYQLARADAERAALITRARARRRTARAHAAAARARRAAA